MVCPRVPNFGTWRRCGYRRPPAALLSRKKNSGSVEPLPNLHRIRRIERSNDVDLGGEIAGHLQTDFLLANFRLGPRLHGVLHLSGPALPPSTECLNT